MDIQGKMNINPEFDLRIRGIFHVGKLVSTGFEEISSGSFKNKRQVVNSS
jgi:hypothetical protein